MYVDYVWCKGTKMKILMIGGNGNISWFCTRKLLDLGHEVYELHRGFTYSTRRDIHLDAKVIKADIRNKKEIKKKLDGVYFDVVCDFICYTGEQARDAIELFKSKTRQYIVISSDVVYERTITNIPFTEESKIRNPEGTSSYIFGKLDVERTFLKAYKLGFPVTVVRPGYTYDTILPVSIGHNCWTAIDKILQGYPLLVGGEGNSIWNMTNSRDFADAFCGLVGNWDSIGESFDIASDEWITWNDASRILLKALGVASDRVFHVPYERALHLPEFQPEDMNYDRMWHSIRTNRKIKQYVPQYNPRVSLEEGIHLSLDWLREKKERRRIVERYEKMLDILYKEFEIKTD